VSLVRALIADAHVATRMGLRMAVEAGSFVVVGEAADADGAIRLAQRLEPEICLLDVSMPGDGVVAAAAIHRTVPSTRVVMVTASEDDADLFGALLAGAVGFVNKSIDPDHLPRALRAVMDGEAAFSRQLVLRIVNEFRTRDSEGWAQLPDRPLTLTEREWQILQLLGSRHTTAEIASLLFVTPITVRSHIASALHKLRVPDRESALQLVHSASRSRAY
jgi:two-component system nitrate/nitrite response regulator NarL